MELTDTQKKEFEILAEAMMRFLCETCHPHTTVIIDGVTAEIVEGCHVHNTEKYLKD